MIRCIMLSLVLTFGGALVPSIRAQETPETSQADPEQSEAAKILDKCLATPIDRVLIDDITVTDVVASLSEEVSLKTGVELNVVVHPRAANLRIKRIELHRVSLKQVFEAISFVTDDEVDFSPSYDGGVLQVDANEPIVTLASRVFNLSTFKEQEISDLQDAIKKGVEFVDQSRSSGPVSILLHPPTKLMFVKGNEDQLTIANDIFLELVRNQPGQSPTSGFGMSGDDDFEGGSGGGSVGNR